MKKIIIITTGALVITFGLILVFALASTLRSESGISTDLATMSGLSNRESPAVGQNPAPSPLPSPTITLMAVGDVMLSRSVNTRMLKYQDWSYPFGDTLDFLLEADLLFGNLESPFNTSCQPTDEGMRFCADPRSVEGLVSANFDVMSLANNHALDQGRSGLEFSLDLLRSQGIIGLSFNQSAVIEKSGVRVDFIAFDDTLSRLDQNLMASLVSKLRADSDVVVASFHWGQEYQPEPTNRQVELARLAVDSGAKLVIGHHPHWLQPIENYQDAVIFYSLGNFVFDQMWSLETRRGGIAVIELDSDGIIDYRLEEVMIYDYARPKLSALDATLPVEKDHREN